MSDGDAAGSRTGAGDIAWAAVADIFADALELPADQRSELIAARTAGRPDARAAVERLLASHDDVSPEFLTTVSAALLDDLASSAPAPAARIGPWRLIREIGRGGMGQVFLAERADGQFEQQVAIKLLKRGMDSDAILARFLRERQILAALDHPNIARLLDGGIADDGRPYFVMEHVAGETITAFADARRLPVDARLTLLGIVCDAVEYAHRNLVVHRDLKPSNILVTADGRPKLLDFGIAKLLSATDNGAETSALTATGVRLLTPDYGAPEQFHGGAITTATDVYGLGAVLFELLAGRPPFESGDTPGTGSARRYDSEPVALSAAVSRADAGRPRAAGTDSIAALRSTDAARLRRRLAGDLDTIVAAALRVAPERRYASVGALHDDLRRHQERLPVRARPDTVGYRASRFVRRNRAAVAAVSAIGLLLTAFAISSAVQSRALAAERDRARLEATSAREVSEFLVGVFEVADPMAPQQRTGVSGGVSASDLLDRGATRIQSDLAGQPAVQARLLGVIGRAFANLQRGDRAVPLLERAVALRRETDGPTSPGVVAALQQLANMHTRTNDFPRAEAALREAIGIQRRIGPDGATLWGLLVELAYVVDASGKHDAGRETAAEAMAVFDRLEPEDFGDSRADLRRIAELIGRSRAPISTYADTVFSRLVAAERAATGPTSTPVAAALTTWATSKARRREWPAADSMLSAAIRIHSVATPSSIIEANTLNQQAMLVLQMGDAARAESLARKALEILIGRLGQDHREVAIMRMTLTFTLQRLDRMDEAIALSRLANATFARNENDAVALLPQNRWDLALMLHRTGRLDEALGEFAEALRIFEARFKADYLATAAVRRDYGAALVDAGRARDAMPVLRRAIEVLSGRWGANDARVDAVRITLGRALAATGQRDEGKRMVRDARDRLVNSRGADDALTKRARETLNQLERSRDR